MSVLSNRVLVLNKTWTAIGTVNVERAIVMLFSTYKNDEPKARVICPESYATFTWQDWSKIKPEEDDLTISGTTLIMKVPEVILLTRYDKMPKPKVHFSRRTLYKRDSQMCQYCGKKPGTQDLTIDHILPRAQGGKTTWENCALACVECNVKKGNRTPEQAHMKLFKVPKKPRLDLFKHDIKKPIKSWTAFIGEAYWNVPLDDS